MHWQIRKFAAVLLLVAVLDLRDRIEQNPYAPGEGRLAGFWGNSEDRKFDVTKRILGTQ